MEVKSFEEYVESKTPHITQELVCLKCLKRWYGVRPITLQLKDIICPYCEDISCVIATGQPLNEEDF